MAHLNYYSNKSTWILYKDRMLRKLTHFLFVTPIPTHKIHCPACYAVHPHKHYTHNINLSIIHLIGHYFTRVYVTHFDLQRHFNEIIKETFTCMIIFAGDFNVKKEYAYNRHYFLLSMTICNW